MATRLRSISKVIVLVALPAELKESDWLFEVPLIYTGVGKINAALETSKAINKFKPEEVINLGTAGSLGPNLGEICEIKSVIQRDVDTFPLAKRGSVPFDEKPNVYYSAGGSFVCGTGDSFITEVDPWLVENSVHLVDMELFAIARVCADASIPWRSFKIVSDLVGKNGNGEWNTGTREAGSLLIEKFSSFWSLQNQF